MRSIYRTATSRPHPAAPARPSRSAAIRSAHSDTAHARDTRRSFLPCSSASSSPPRPVALPLSSHRSAGLAPMRPRASVRVSPPTRRRLGPPRAHHCFPAAASALPHDLGMLVRIEPRLQVPSPPGGCSVEATTILTRGGGYRRRLGNSLELWRIHQPPGDAVWSAVDQLRVRHPWQRRAACRSWLRVR